MTEEHLEALQRLLNRDREMEHMTGAGFLAPHEAAALSAVLREFESSDEDFDQSFLEDLQRETTGC